MASPLIPVADPKAGYLAHKEEIDAAIHRVLGSGRYVLGSEVEALEREFAAYIGVRHAVGVASGTDALQLALRACGVGMGDIVFTVSHTAVATVAAIELSGATPLLVDIDLTTYTMDPECLSGAVKASTRYEFSSSVGRLSPKAIVPVHLYGHPADMPAIIDIARRYGLQVLEDCAQSHGAILNGRKAGTWGDIAAFSFYPTKNLGALGDAGMVTTDNADLATRLRLLRQYGWRQRYVSQVPGLNSRLDELQAAILRTKLGYLDENTRRRQALAKLYDEALSATGLVLPMCLPEASHVYHQYVVRSEDRDPLRAFLRERGIGTLIHYPVPIHRQPAYQARLSCAGSIVNTERAAREILSLPMYSELTADQVHRVAEAVVSWECSRGV
jgi:dTDP-4-amino-4,6-dideoxygalactose transaminase